MYMYVYVYISYIVRYMIHTLHTTSGTWRGQDGHEGLRQGPELLAPVDELEVQEAS